MLTADLVGARRRGDELRLAPTDDARRARIAALATALIARVRGEVGKTRDEVDEALRETVAALEAADAADVAQGSKAGSDRRLSAAVGKLVKDGLRFEESVAGDATELRRDLFRSAAAARRAAPAAPFDRAAFLDTYARERQTTAGALETALYRDRPGAQRLLAVETPAPALLVAGFEIAEAQAVLLRATKIVAEIEARDAALYRRLFRSLKFLRLLPVIAPAGKRGGYRVEMDGPLSLFQSAGRYGLSLALALPAIAACDAWKIEAHVRWGAERRPLRFRLAGRNTAAVDPPGEAPPGKAPPGKAPPGKAPPGKAPPGKAAPADTLPDELATFIAAFERAKSDWRIDAAPAILDLPGVGLCVPDLCFVRGSDGARVFFELLGFWSREAVFKRIDLVRAGLPHKILFAASKSLRVGEALLDDAPEAALYVFSRVLNVGAILDHLARLAPKQ